MKKHLISAFIALLSTTMIAQTILSDDECSRCGNVFLESPECTINTQFRALIVKPSANHLHYAAQATPLPIQSPNWSIFDVRPKYHFGFDVGIQGTFHNRCTNMAANWIHFKSSTKNEQQVPVDTDMIGPLFEIGPDAQPYKSATGKAKFNFNTAHLTYGQWVQFGNCLQVNFFAGINVTSIKQRLIAVFSNPDATITRTINTPSSFVGAGPEFGCEVSYDIVKGLQLTGKCSATILAGPSKNNTTYTSVSPLLDIPNFTSPNVQQTSVQKRTQVVPGFEERLGLGYSFCLWDQYTFDLEVGWQALVYLNALQSVDMGSEVIGVKPVPSTVGVFARTFQRTLSNFALTGPYVGFTIAF